jgi:hypothetical protein
VYGSFHNPTLTPPEVLHCIHRRSMKVLIAGDVQGNLNLLSGKVESLNSSKHGPFDVVFCVGNFFDSNVPDFVEFLKGEKFFPLPCFFVGGEQDFVGQQKDLLVNGGSEICKNVTYLGTSGMLVQNNLTVAYLSANAGAGDVVDLCQQAKLHKTAIDFFLSHTWGYKCEGADGAEHFSDVVIRVVKEVAPRYHFAGSNGVYFKRPPYSNTSQATTTRFIGMGAVQKTKDKSKQWLHALTIAPLTPSSLAPQDPTVPGLCDPVTEAKKRERSDETLRTPNFDAAMAARLEAEDAQKGQFRFREQALHQSGCHHTRHPKKRPRVHIPGRTDCWFCLASPTCEKQLIVSVAEETYLCLPKGGISAGHLLVVPIVHEESMALVHSTVVQEVAQYIQALKAFFTAHNEKPIVIERCVTTKGPQHHTYIEVIPLPADRVKNANDAFEYECELRGLKFEQMKSTDSIQSAAPIDRQYIHIELCDGRRFLHKVNAEQRDAGKVPLQFGRQIAAKALGCPERAHWKNCVVSGEEETRLAEGFKQVFRPFDWTLKC